MTVYEYLKEKWKTQEVQEATRRIMKHFASSETIPIINEKARRRGMSYGKYVLARENGRFEEDKYVKIKLTHESRLAWCRKQYKPKG